MAPRSTGIGVRPRTWANAGPPNSGSTGTRVNEAQPNDLLMDTDSKVLFINEGSLASPYWTPLTYDNPALFGVHGDFRTGLGKAIANTDAAAFLADSGIRIFGEGITETDSGAVVQAAGEGGQGLIRLTTTDEVLHTIAMGMAAGVMQPDQHKILVVDVILTHVSAITLRSMFLGFVGEAADVMRPPVSGASTTITFSATGNEGDDLAGIMFDVGLSDSNGLMACHNKSDAAATQDLTGGRDTGVNIAAAGTEQRFRVEIAANGDMRIFADKVQLYTAVIVLDVDEECSPVLVLESTSTANKSMDVRRFDAYAYR